MNRILSPLRRAALLATMAISVIPTAVAATTTIHPGDRVTVTVYNHTELSTVSTIRSDGTAAVPLVGPIKFGGESEQGAAAMVTARMKQIIKYPAVSVVVTEQASSIFFTGALNFVGTYQPGETLASAIGAITTKGSNDTAKGNNEEVSTVASSVDFRYIRIERNGKFIPNAFDLEALARSGSAGPLIEPGDVVHLRTKPVKVELRGNTPSPGYVFLYPGDSLNSAITRQTAIQPSTSLTSIILRRNGRDTLISIAGIEMTSPAQDNDVLILTPAPHVSVIGAVEHPGDVVLQSQADLLNAIYLAGGPKKTAEINHIRVMHLGKTSNHDLSKLAKGDLTGNTMLADGDSVIIPEGHHVDLAGIASAFGFFATLKYVLGR